MNKITRIHIAKVPYDIEHEAEPVLSQYLADLRSALKADGTNDTMADIELHITEILDERKVKSGGVITIADVHAIQQQLGQPSQLAEGSGAEPKSPPAVGSRRPALFAMLAGALALLLIVSVALWWNRLPLGIQTKTEQHVYAQDITKLVMVVESGNIDVRTGPAKEVSLTRDFKWRGEKPVVREQWDGTQLRITVECLQDNNCSVDYTMTVPATTALDMQTVAGGIEIEGVQANAKLATTAGTIGLDGIEGEIEAQTTDGKISGRELRSKTVRAQTTAGGIDLQFAVAPTEVVAKGLSGYITVDVPSGDVYTVNAQTSAGRHDITVQQDQQAERHIDIQTQAGDVTVRYNRG